MTKTKPKPKPKPKPKYDYDISGKYVVCFKSDVSKCTVDARLLQAETSNFHDAVLQEATREVNEIIARLDRANNDSSRHLSFIDVEGQRMLVWANHGGRVASGADDIAEALMITDHRRNK